MSAIDPHASPWCLFGAVMRHCRGSRPNLGLRRAAEQMYTDFSNLAKWERGERVPPPDMIMRLDQVYGAQGILTALYATLERLDAAESEQRNAGRYRGNSAYCNGDDDMERRAALQFLAGLGTLGSLGISGEPLRQLLDISLGQEHRSLEDWDLACADHLHALRTRPPAQVATDLIIDLYALRRQLDTATPADQIELQRSMAVLASLHAIVLTYMDDHGGAMRWWRTARQAADLSGDLALRLLVRCEEAGHGLYGQRSPQAVLELVRRAQQLTQDPDADLMTTEAKALSMLGRHDQALDTLHSLHETADKGFAPDYYGFWTPNRIYFTESWVYAAAGQELAAETARSNVLKHNRSYIHPVNADLHRALCTVVQGGIDDGMHQAATTIDALKPSQRVRHITETGHIVLRAVPRDQRDRPSVAEFRKVLAVEPVRGG
ncbi:helix-turn-helix domain-containing protein [Sphaerisporangium dianthi]|uniref:Helix-turn-helix domain-containing protein n=1 Tax=Sphaerisporangium dianthi TaxID=1436120 RepID=A0ABV9CT71_9ACTN